MALLDEMAAQIKRQPGKRYRFVRLDADNVTRKTVEGFQFSRKEDPSIKGTILEKHVGADGQIRVGGMAIMEISETAARAKEKKTEDKMKAHLSAIQANYQKAGENIKRELGTAHKAFKPIVEDKE